MLTTPELQAIALHVKTAQDRCLPLAQITAQYPGFDAASAYASADLIHAMRLSEGARPVGRKIGFTNPAMWTQYGVSAPIWGYVYDTTVTYLDDAAVTQNCSLRGLAHPKIEPEIIFHFHSTPPQGADVDAVLACIDWVAHGFELVQSHYPGWKFQAPDAIADGGLHAKLVVGERHLVNTLGENLKDKLATFTLALSSDGQLKETGKGANVLGNPLQALVHLMQVLKTQPLYQPLQGNELVTTGTVTSAYSVQPGQVWRSAIDGMALSGLSVAFTA